MNNCRCRSLRCLDIFIYTYSNKCLHYRCFSISFSYHDNHIYLDLVFWHKNKPYTLLRFKYSTISSFEVFDFYRRFNNV